MKSKKREFISFDELFYVKKSANLENDVLFENAVEELHLNNAFEYQMSVFRENENAHIFLTHIKNLDKKESVYPQPLIFSALYPKFVKEKKFCVVFFGENFSFVSYFEKTHFIGLKNLPQFGLKDLSLKENREEYFQNYGILEHLMQNDLVLSVNDNFGFGAWLTQYHKHLKMESLLKDEPQNALCLLCHFPSEVDFIKKNELNLKPIFVGFGAFFGAFLISLAFLLVRDYPKYKENRLILQNNASLKEQLNALNLELSFLKKSVKDLNFTHQNNTLLIKQNEEFTEALKTEINPKKDKFNTIFTLFKLLNQNEIKIIFLSLNDNVIKLVFSEEVQFEKALNFFSNALKFKVLSRENLELVLEFNLA
ncbi:hypothetical protein [Campylobacter helveticus]|uniref:Type II secretion system protein L n=6 Tax=Campylobacter helveticus TaxID=28898 RepID=A0ABY3KZ79_9BACT|nr:hypothetical protein [Campylobacter helveticus]QBL11958.1 hypothetical protein A0073_05680 [Campylobacter helveticus]TNH32792.1 hypothetical protein FDW46_08650 [Campylobacter helveticus]TNH35063.1 hypothetical protein FDW45_08180 [Campylobacter helveticus]TXK53804.1 hypothetical protein FVD16_09740 [Campylobacter helveticus]